MVKGKQKDVRCFKVVPKGVNASAITPVQNRIWDILNLSMFADRSTNTKTDRNRQKWRRRKNSHMSHVMCHMSHVMCLVPRVKCHVSPDTCP